MPTENYDLRNNLTTMMYSGQSANLREDLIYTARDQQSLLTRYSNLAATVTVGTTSMGYDAVGRLTNLQHKDASAVNIANYTHTYDAASRVTTEKLNAGATTTYQYDNTDQLTNDAVVTYTYDSNGNRTMSGYATGPNNQLTSDARPTHQILAGLLAGGLNRTSEQGVESSRSLEATHLHGEEACPVPRSPLRSTFVPSRIPASKGARSTCFWTLW